LYHCSYLLPYTTLFRSMSVRAPIGVVGLITPWNFPVAIATWKSFPAIVAGNTFVWKPATETPMMAYEMALIFEEAGLPEGVANIDRKSTRLNSSHVKIS